VGKHEGSSGPWFRGQAPTQAPDTRNATASKHADEADAHSTKASSAAHIAPRRSPAYVAARGGSVGDEISGKLAAARIAPGRATTAQVKVWQWLATLRI
jgi:hypothetical protein